MMIFTVVIEDWARGKDKLVNLLLDPDDGKRCCLGFACKNMGVLDAEMNKRSSPYRLTQDTWGKVKGVLLNTYSSSVEGNYAYHTNFTTEAILTNDDPNISDDERMKKLRAIARKYGHQFRFVHKQAA